MYSTGSIVIGVSLTLLALMSIPAYAGAASYAYVDASGDVRSVTAIDWMTAIRIAPNIHVHSGVLLLDSAADFSIVGDNVAGY